MSRRLALCTVLAALLWALPLQARGAAPVSRTSLPNGLVLLVQENPGEDIVAIELLVGVGLAQEGSNLEGIVHLLGQLLVNRITEDVSGADVVEVTGSLVTATSEPDYARLSIQTTSRHFPFMMRRLGAALRQRTLSEAEVAEVREDLLEEIRSSNKTFSALYGIFLENFYRYHPYRRTGTGSEASVQRLDASVVNPFFSKYYVPNRMVLSVAGRVDRVQVANLVRSELGGLAAVPQRSVDIQWEPRSAEKEVILAAGSRLAWVFLGFPAPGVRSQDYAPMRVIQSYLAEGLSSRLWTELREKRGLAYELGSVYPELEGPSHLLTYIITQPDRVGETRRRILGEVDRIKKQGLTPTELEETRRKLEGEYLLARETNQGKAFHLALAEIQGQGYEADLNFLAALEQVTPAQVQRVAQQYLDTYTLVVARPGGRFYFDF